MIAAPSYVQCSVHCTLYSLTPVTAIVEARKYSLAESLRSREEKIQLVPRLPTWRHLAGADADTDADTDADADADADADPGLMLY